MHSGDRFKSPPYVITTVYLTVDDMYVEARGERVPATEDEAALLGGDLAYHCDDGHVLVCL
ncbi:MAG: hypothetical protein AAGC55_10655 [Myxococcota bacterium]